MVGQSVSQIVNQFIVSQKKINVNNLHVSDSQSISQQASDHPAGFIHQSKALTRFSLCSSVSVRSDSTPDTSPEFGSRNRIPKRRIHRSSAPAQLTTGSTQLSSPPSVSAPASIKSEPAATLEPESPDIFMSVSMDSEPSVNQDTDLEIEGGGADSESIDPGMVECMEVEEEEDVNGDVIRCLCNESEEGGFMIQVILRAPKLSFLGGRQVATKHFCF